MSARETRLLQGLYGGGVALYLATLLSPADAVPLLQGLFLGTVATPLFRPSPPALLLSAVSVASAVLVAARGERGRLRWPLAAGALLSWAPTLLVCLRRAPRWTGGTAAPSPPAPAALTTVEPGVSYLMSEPDPARLLEVFQRLLGQGYRGLAITRVNPAQLPESLRAAEAAHLTQSILKASDLQVPERLRATGADVRWLTDVPGERNVNPLEMERIQWIVGEFLEAGEGPRAVLFDGFLTVAARNGFQPALKLTQSLRDMAAARGAVLLLSADLRALSAGEGALLQQGIRVVGGQA